MKDGYNVYNYDELLQATTVVNRIVVQQAHLNPLKIRMTQTGLKNMLIQNFYYNSQQSNLLDNEVYRLPQHTIINILMTGI